MECCHVVADFDYMTDKQDNRLQKSVSCVILFVVKETSNDIILPMAKGCDEMRWTRKMMVMALVVLMLAAQGFMGRTAGAVGKPVVGDTQVKLTVEGETELPGNFYLSFAFSRNLIMLDGKGNIVWSKHEEQPEEGSSTGWWDFKKHVVDGRTYYSYHDETGNYDTYGLLGYAPGERVILDENFNEVKRITLEASDVTAKGDPVDGHDFLMIDLDHYILSAYLHDTVYNIPGHEQGSKVVYSYLQEVDHGKVVWDWKSIDYPELARFTVTDAVEDVNDFANERTDVPDYVHFNAMDLDPDGHLICSLRHINSILCLDRTKRSDQILWKLSGGADEFGLTESQKTSCQHYVIVDGGYLTAFDNNNRGKETRIVSYAVDAEKRKANAVRMYAFPGKFSYACGSVQHLPGDIYVIGWGWTVRDAECMSVYDFSKGQKLMSVTLGNPKNNTYRCVYYD